MSTKFRYAAVGLIAAVLLFGSGCGESLPTLEDLNDTNIRRVHSAYSIFMKRNGNVGPESEEELRSFLTTNHTAKVLLERMGIETETLDDIFISERDGQPFKFRWGLTGIADHAIVFEAEGVEGKRMVAFALPRELEPDQYEGFWTGKLSGAKPGQEIQERTSGETN